MPAATATLSDSTGGRSGARRAGRRAPRRGRQSPSLVPDHDGDARRRGVERDRGSPVASAAQSRTGRSRRNASSSSQVPVRQGWWKCAPIPLRTTLAFQRSTVPGRAIVAVRAEGRRRAHDRADVSWVLNGVQDQQTERRPAREGLQGPVRHLGDARMPCGDSVSAALANSW